ncbi:MAG: hypothetical protein ABEJ42_08760 [Halobacteriaceae archaeon]
MSAHTYEVAFDVNGTVKKVDVGSVKSGNGYLRCMRDMANNDGALVAMVPLDAVEYVVHRGLTVSTSAPLGERDVDAA